MLFDLFILLGYLIIMQVHCVVLCLVLAQCKAIS